MALQSTYTSNNPRGDVEYENTARSIDHDTEAIFTNWNQAMCL
jgi:hypothetical protein